MLNLWRVLKGELKLGSYSYEDCAFALLRRRCPRLPRRQLAAWFGAAPSRWRAVGCVAARARGVADMVEALDLVVRTAELAKVFGIDFHSVLLRGSQFRVESLLSRLAHTQAGGSSPDSDSGSDPDF